MLRPLFPARAITSALSSRATSSVYQYGRSHTTGGAIALDRKVSHDPQISLQKVVDPFALLVPELTYVRENLLTLLGSSHPSISDIASYYFMLPGKQLRPLIVLLMSCATNGLTSGFHSKLTNPQNCTSGTYRYELDITLSSPHILNDWNPRMPDHTASFQVPFSLPNFYHPLASSAQNSTSSSDVKAPPADSRVLPTQLRLAQIAEMIHVASLLHDDVLDTAETRRTASSAPSAFGNKLSILGGDFLLGRASAALARLGENEAVELVATVLSNLVEGEVLQMRREISEGGTGTPVAPVLGEQVWTTYIRKSYLKTASLMAKFARASVVLGGALPGSEADEMLKDIAYAYGRNLGIAFQLVDDALDFSPSRDLGKPGYGTDLKLGLATAPTLYAWEEHPEMAELVARRFKHQGDVEQARTLVMHSNALERTRNLAKEYSNKALEVLDRLPHTDAKDALASLASTVVERAR